MSIQLDPRFRVRRRDRLSLLLFAALWILPMIYMGLTHKNVPYLGKRLNINYRVACLFTRHIAYWTDPYVQVQSEGGRWAWLDDLAYSRHRPFGHRTRLQRMIELSLAEHHGMLQRQQIAEFIQTRHQELFPDEPPIRAVRFIASYYRSGEPMLASPEGEWVRRPPEDVEPDRLKLVSTHFFDGRRPLNEQNQPTVFLPKKKTKR
jgi:hypothetical protein